MGSNQAARAGWLGQGNQAASNNARVLAPTSTAQSGLDRAKPTQSQPNSNPTHRNPTSPAQPNLLPTACCPPTQTSPTHLPAQTADYLPCSRSCRSPHADGLAPRLSEGNRSASNCSASRATPWWSTWRLVHRPAAAAARAGKSWGGSGGLRLWLS